MITPRHFLILIALAFPCAPAQADSSDIPEWYGTIKFSKTLKRHSDDPLEFQGQPGKKFSDVNVTWSGAIRFLPDRKAVVTATYTFTRLVDRREESTRPCPWKDGKLPYHDYQTMKEETHVAVNRAENNHLAFILRPDGSYRVSVIVGGGKQVDKATRYKGRREFYGECSVPNLKIEPQEGDGSGGMESLTLAHVEGKAKPGAKILSGNYSAPDDDEGKLSYSWELTLAPPELVARVQATPATVVRGASVTLDGKASTGKIDKYEWQFTPDGDCQMIPAGLTLKLTGPTVSFTALCDFTAELRVSNSTASDRAWQPVIVEARKGEAWTTKWVPPSHATFAEPMLAGEAFAGKNRCRLHSTDEEQHHWIHTTSSNNKTWRDVGYVLAQVRDSGPFNGEWYVRSQSLQIDRQELVNTEILPAGSVYKLNSEKNKTNIDGWGAQAKAHEAMHSTLANEKLIMLGHDGDAAVIIEKRVSGGEGEDLYQTLVDKEIREVDQTLAAATTEERVATRLRSDSRFKDDLSIWFSNSTDSAKNMGPLWMLGYEPTWK